MLGVIPPHTLTPQSFDTVIDFNGITAKAYPAPTGPASFTSLQKTDGANHQWTFNDAGTNPLADSVGTSNATPTGITAGAAITGDTTASASFNGTTSQIALPFKDVPVPWSWEFLFKPASNTGTQTLFANANGTNQGIQVSFTSTGLTFFMSGFGWTRTLTAGIAINVGTVYHVVIECVGTPGGGLALYVNNVAYGGTTEPDNYNGGQVNMAAGYNPQGITGYYTGTMAALASYPSIVSAATVAAHYAAIANAYAGPISPDAWVSYD